MAIDLSQYLVIGISSRALFDLAMEDEIYKRDGLKAYENYQLDNEHVILNPGAGFPLIKAILTRHSRNQIFCVTYPYAQ